MQEPAGVGAEGVARRRTRRWLVTVLASTFVITAAGLVAGFVAGSRHHPGRHPSLGPFIAALAAVTLTLAVLGLIFWRLFNRPRYQRVMQYGWRRRTRVAKALRRGKPIEPGDVAVADAVVELMRSQRAIFWFQPLMIAIWVINALTHHGSVRWLYVGLVLATGPAVLWSVWMQRRTIRNWDARPKAAGRQDGTVGG